MTTVSKAKENAIRRCQIVISESENYDSATNSLLKRESILKERIKTALNKKEYESISEELIEIDRILKILK